jgi:hypothetical protein
MPILNPGHQSRNRIALFFFSNETTLYTSSRCRRQPAAALPYGRLHLTVRFLKFEAFSGDIGDGEMLLVRFLGREDRAVVDHGGNWTRG